MSQSYYFPDPIQGTIELPPWLVSIKDTPAVRRMMFIRQLGLKAYIDFPGAIHTRYSHALGTMHLAGRMTKMLIEKMQNKGKTHIAQNLKDNLNNIMAAGFLHDIGHAPFSHAADFVLKKITGKTHEELSEVIVKDKIPSEIEDHGITKSSVIQLIKTRGHRNPFLSHIINGPLDSDKLDYLLRDAYHVGLKYSFDLDHFLRSFTVLGENSDLSTCILGLDSTKQAIVTAELFIVIWKSMYDLVYFIKNSRIAEKMLEKAFLLNDNDPSIKEMFQLDNFLRCNDENMLDKLENMGTEIAQLLAPENPARLYKEVLDKELTETNYKMTPNFIAKLENDPDELADVLSLRLAEELGQSKYSIICDIVKSKAPREIYLDNNGSSGEVYLRNKSDIVGIMKAKNTLKVYISPIILKQVEPKDIERKLVEMIEGDSDI